MPDRKTSTCFRPISVYYPQAHLEKVVFTQG